MRIVKPKNPNRVAAGRLNREKRRQLSPEGIQRLRDSAIANKPWQRATGPRTEEGKAIVAKNAIKKKTEIPEKPDWMSLAVNLEKSLKKLRASYYLDVSRLEFVQSDQIAEQLRALVPLTNVSFAHDLSRELMHGRSD